MTGSLLVMLVCMGQLCKVIELPLPDVDLIACPTTSVLILPQVELPPGAEIGAWTCLPPGEMI